VKATIPKTEVKTDVAKPTEAKPKAENKDLTKAKVEKKAEPVKADVKVLPQVVNATKKAAPVEAPKAKAVEVKAVEVKAKAVEVKAVEVKAPKYSINDLSQVKTPKATSLIQLKEYPQPDIRGPMPRNSHPDSTFSSHLHNDWTFVQQSDNEYPSPDIRGPMPENAHPDSTFSSHLHNDWTHVQLSATEGKLEPAYWGEPIIDHRLYEFENPGDF
jgi:hypothetical protein